MSQLHFGTIAVISADNPASSALGGFKESGAAYRYCRQCLGTYDETSTKVMLKGSLIGWYYNPYNIAILDDHFMSLLYYSFMKKILL